MLTRSNEMQDRTLPISRQQSRVDPARLKLLLSQQMCLMFKYRVLYLPLYFSRQPVFSVKTLNALLTQRRTTHNPIQRVVLIAAQHRFSLPRHGVAPFLIQGFG
ncbi:hypothetical protein [Pseudomonas sp. Irchel s3b2]|uniref:hypothetical protein n=1 Tax=Pseudomonas sp. Irchel s3b2 TaxID=2009073 RepID=UPI00159519A2|nr:hypothetical protein [Pseudomonas sp. Irchel s3b2]